ncbi:MAG TPA: Hsp20/alpha crystallin family protein [Gemmatimonadaceae bacterium]|nr:Hsp20/alpha crystallin family protein [Gemmatimonadaceae bacterium]
MLDNRSLSSTLDRMLTLNRALDQAFAANGATGRASWVPAMDIAERTDHYSIQVDLPGVNPSEVELGFEKNVLTLRGTKPSVLDTRTEEEYRLHARERASGAFERAVRLPDSVDADGIDARFSHGVLTIVIPKAKAAQPRRIEIRALDAQPSAEAVEAGNK